MTRICSKATREKVAKMKLPPRSPQWLRSAVWNARSGYPMSAEGETRMCKALGIASPKRAPRRFYRPCLSVELGEAIREDRIDLESLLWTVIVAGRQERKKRAA